ncbi:MAG: hypothetical protein RIR65_142, partial [Planctomycetota bacterium]
MGGNESTQAFDRRAVLRAAGVALSLPLLESLAPRASASESRKAPAR